MNTPTTIQAGNLTKAEALEKLEERFSFISHWARDLIEKRLPDNLNWPRPITIVRCTIKDLKNELGDNLESISTKEILDRALLIKLGLQICEPEDALVIAIQFQVKTIYEWHYVMHDPIMDSFGTPSMFSLALDGTGLRLDSATSWPKTSWSTSVEEGKKNQYLFFRKK